jgi:hypothetical protein
MWCWGRMERISWIDHVRNEMKYENGRLTSSQNSAASSHCMEPEGPLPNSQAPPTYPYPEPD